MLLKIQIENYHRSNPLVYLNNHRTSGDKHNPLSFSENARLILTVNAKENSVSKELIKEFANHYLFLLLRKSKNKSAISISFLKAKNEFDFYEEVETHYYNTSLKDLKNQFVKKLLEKQDFFFCPLGYLTSKDLEAIFHLNNQPDLTDFEELCLSFIDKNNEIDGSKEDGFLHLDCQVNELLTKSCGNFLAQENFVYKQNILETIVMQIVYLKNYHFLSSNLIDKLKSFTYFDEEVFNSFKTEGKQYEYFVEKLFQSVAPLASKMIKLKQSKSDKIHRIDFTFNNFVSLNNKIICLINFSKEDCELDNSSVLQLNLNNTFQKEKIVKDSLKKLQHELNQAFNIILKGENVIKRNRKSLVEHLEKSLDIYKQLTFSWDLIKF